MKKLLVILFVLGFWSLAAADESKSGGNVCYTENVKADKGSTFKVGVFVDNVDTLVAMQIPVYYRSEDVDLKCDSVSFVDTRLADQKLSFFKIEPVGKVAFFAFLAMTQLDPSSPMLNPGKGPVANIWFTAARDIKSGKVRLEGGPQAFLPHETIDYGYHFWVETSGEQVTREVDCEYRPGEITIK